MPGLAGGTWLPMLCFASTQIRGAAPAHLPGAGRLLHPPPGAGLCHRSAGSHRQRAHRFGEGQLGRGVGDRNPLGGQDAAVGDTGRDGCDIPLTSPPQLVLLPRYSSLEMFIAGDPSSMERRQTFERYRCAQPFHAAGPSPVAEPCSSLLHSLSAILHDGALREYSSTPHTAPCPAPCSSRCSPPLCPQPASVTPRARSAPSAGPRVGSASANPTSWDGAATAAPREPSALGPADAEVSAARLCHPSLERSPSTPGLGAPGRGAFCSSGTDTGGAVPSSVPVQQRGVGEHGLRQCHGAVLLP